MIRVAIDAMGGDHAPAVPVAAAAMALGELPPDIKIQLVGQAKLATVVRSECRRCLVPVDVPLSQSLGLVFVGEEDATRDDDCYVVPRRATTLDLAHAVREELVLAVPQFVECRQDCRGLCPRCGADLNAGPCGCQRETDPRWEALTKLRKGG